MTKLKKTGIKLTADPKRVLLLPFSPGNEQRIRKIVNRIIKLTDDKAALLLEEINNKFMQRHKIGRAHV